jgi:hypothetical protein
MLTSTTPPKREQIKSMQTLLKRMKAKWHCKTLEVCGKGILESGISRVERPPLPVTPDHSCLR